MGFDESKQEMPVPLKRTLDRALAHLLGTKLCELRNAIAHHHGPLGSHLDDLMALRKLFNDAEGRVFEDETSAGNFDWNFVPQLIAEDLRDERSYRFGASATQLSRLETHSYSFLSWRAIIGHRGRASRCFWIASPAGRRLVRSFRAVLSIMRPLVHVTRDVFCGRSWTRRAWFLLHGSHPPKTHQLTVLVLGV